ncbi:DUF6011 domain-containing protein [Streptomyces sp. 4N509B]|uniref:DUF6011 domain-containing protein n=1 Tax=Streptomyces sp. 4N509B TaxID=3457413 RepID=UPI003FD1769B
MTEETEPLPGLESTESQQLPPVVCRLCGRPLHDRVARQWRLGPECREKLGVRLALDPAAHEVEQEALPGMT